MGPSCGPLLAREKGSPEWLARGTRDVPQDPDLLLSFDPDGPPVPPPFATAYNRGKCRSRETCSSSTTITLVAPRGAHALIRMAFVCRRSFSLNDKAIDAPALIVGERPLRICSWSGMFPRLVRQGPSSRAVSVPARLQEGIGDELGLAPESSRKRTRRTPWQGWSDAGLRPARRRMWRICRWRFKGLTGDDRTRCAGCGRRQDAVVAEPRWAFVGLIHPSGSERAPPRPLTPEGGLIPVGVDSPGRRSRRRRVSGSGRASRAAIPLRPA
jgi:hypothetical protein